MNCNQEQYTKDQTSGSTRYAIVLYKEGALYYIRKRHLSTQANLVGALQLANYSQLTRPSLDGAADVEPPYCLILILRAFPSGP